MKQLRWFICLIAISLLGGFALAQSPTGTIQGMVTDKTGAAVQGASITIVNSATNQTRSTATDSDGRYVIPFVEPGTYAVNVKAQGFRPAKQVDILVEVASTRPVNFSLELGAVTQTVEVSATTENLDVDTSSLGETIQSQTTLQLPDQGRNIYDFALLVPGVNDGPGNTEGASTPHIGGSRNANNEIMIDGLTNILPENNVGNNEMNYTPVEDSIEEVNVETSVLPAEAGRFSGGEITMITKSGTNKLRGSFFEFIQNGELDAAPFGTPGVKDTNDTKPNMHQYQTGGTVGGPIVIPHVYDGHDKAFFFFDYQNTHNVAGQTSIYSVPNPAWYGGDFSSLFGTTTPVLYDPDTVALQSNGSYQRTPFVSGGDYNILPSGRISPIVQAALKYYPQPNIENGTVVVPGQQNAGQYPTYNNFQQTGSVPTDTWNFDSKVDVNVNKNWHSAVRYSQSHQIGSAFNDYDNVASPGNYGGAYRTDAYSGTFNNTVTFSPTLLGEFRYGFSRNLYNRVPLGAGFMPSTLGFDQGFETQAAMEGLMFPHFNFGGNGGFSDLGPQGWEEYQEDPSAQTVNGSIIKIHGGHSFKMGGEFRELRLNFYQWAYPDGTFQSSDDWTRQNPAGFVGNYNSTSGALQAGSGFSLASLLLGLPDGGGSSYISEDARVISTSQYWAAYAQDDWKVSPKLTLNIGLRYDMEIPREEQNNKMSFWDPNAASPLQGQSAAIGTALTSAGESCPACGGLLGAMTLVGTPGAEYGRRQGPTQKRDFGPRFGLAYNATPKIVIRAGIGVVYQPSALQAAGTDGASGDDGFSTSTNFQSTLDGMDTPPIATLYGNDPALSASNGGAAQVPFPTGYNTPQAETSACLSSSSCVQGIDIGNSIGGNGSFFGSYRNPYTIQWNTNVQFAAPGGIKLEIGYLANKGLFLIDGDPGKPFDQLTPATLQQYGCTQNATSCPLTSPVANPFYSTIGNPSSPYYQAGLPLGGTTVDMGQLLKRYPQYANIYSFRKGDATSMYNGLTIRADKQVSHGLTFTLAFTDGREFDNASSAVTYLGAYSDTYADEYNPKAEWGIGAQSIAYTVAGSFTYELPFGHGQPLLRACLRSLYQETPGTPERYMQPVLRSSNQEG